MSAQDATQDAQQIADQLVTQAQQAAAIFTQYSQQEVDAIVTAAASAGAAKRLELARMACEETGKGVFEDKVIKNLFATEYILNDIRNRKTVGLIEDNPETGLLEFAEPLGVILGITPITNPTSTAMFKILISLKTRNAIIICASKNAHRCTNEAARILYEAALAAGAPEDCVRWVETPSHELTNALMRHRGMSLILATGGMGLVKAAYGSGIPAIGVGPGNVPVYIEKSADILVAVNDVLMSKTFDNGMICASEQAVVVDAEIEAPVIERFQSQGGYFLLPDEISKVTSVVIDQKKQSMASEAVGQPAARLAEMAGITVPRGTRLLIARLPGVGEQVPLSREKLCPVLGFYSVKSFDEGVNLCTDLTHFGGLGHSASLFSRDEKAIRAFAATINAGRILVNSPSSHGAIGGIYNRLTPSLTLGCGAGGKNITTDNVSVGHLLNIKRVSKCMNNIKWFRVPSQIYFETGCLHTFFQNELRGLGAHRAWIVCSGSAIRNGIVDIIEDYLRQAGILSTVYSDIQPDPTIAAITRAVEAMRGFRPDLIIAVGGGSPIDAAKAMWLLYESPNLDFEHMRLRFMDIRKRIVRYPAMARKARMICIPTTSGTGAEVTAFSVVTDEKTRTKYPLADYALTPDIAIVDPALTVTTPANVTADTGFDVLSHAIESYVSIMASDYTDPLALQAARLVFTYLPRAYANGQDAEAREKMHNASTIAGMAFTNAFLGINHCLAHILGATFHIAHGRANALVLREVIRYNASLPHKFPAFPNYRIPCAAERYAEIARMLGLPSSSTAEAIESLVDALTKLMQKLDMPLSIRDAGVAPEAFEAELERMSLAAFDDQCASANPSFPLVQDLTAILRASYQPASTRP
jgi:acetaldehyde dehydrogenase / alcohol dehydrogenase